MGSTVHHGIPYMYGIRVPMLGETEGPTYHVYRRAKGDYANVESKVRSSNIMNSYELSPILYYQLIVLEKQILHALIRDEI